MGRGPSQELYGLPIASSPSVAEGEMVVGKDLGRSLYVVGPKTFWSLQHGGAWPGLSRYAPGMVALGLDRRRHPRPKWSGVKSGYRTPDSISVPDPRHAHFNSNHYPGGPRG